MWCGRLCRDRFLVLGQWPLFHGLQASEGGGGGVGRRVQRGGGDWSPSSCSPSTLLQCADVGAGPANIL